TRSSSWTSAGSRTARAGRTRSVTPAATAPATSSADGRRRAAAEAPAGAGGTSGRGSLAGGPLRGGEGDQFVVPPERQAGVPFGRPHQFRRRAGRRRRGIPDAGRAGVRDADQLLPAGREADRLDPVGVRPRAAEG